VADFSVDSIKEFFVLLLAGVMAGMLLYVFDRALAPQLSKAGVPIGSL
jgi:hypothetical protein